MIEEESGGNGTLSALLDPRLRGYAALVLEMETEDRAGEGVFLAFQYPVEIPGIVNRHFLKTAVNSIRKYRGEEQLDTMEFLGLVRDKMELLDMDRSLLDRAVNEPARLSVCR